MQPKESKRAKIDLRDEGEGCGLCNPVAASSMTSDGGEAIAPATAAAGVALANETRDTACFPSDE